MTAVLTDPTPSAPSPTAPVRRSARASRVSLLVRGDPADPRWERPALFGLLAATAVLYLWGLNQTGWANSFYSAAAQAGSVSWKAFFFGSFDASGAITVDKPPASLWLMALSVRVFGLSAWAILLPQALAGVAGVGLLYAAVRRAAGPVAGLLAGLVLALTPVAVLMFRFNNPDALLVLLMVAAAYAVQRAVGSGRTRWLVLAGVLIGFGFLTKQLQVLLVVPGLALAYLVAGPVSLGRRIGQLLAAGLAMVVAAGWWVAIVELLPASMRPYIGGSQTNSVLELALGYNGLGRLTGNETGSVGGGGGWGQTGLGRLFDNEIGGQIGWLLPAALALTVAALYALRRAPRTDPRRAAVVMWAGWLVVSGFVFSLMSGIFHAYYTVALAPAVAALVAVGGVLLWRDRAELWARVTLAAVLAGSAMWAFVLLDRSPAFAPWLRYAVLVAGVVAALVLAWAQLAPRVLTAVTVLAALFAVLAGPMGYALVTAGTDYHGAIVTAGPRVTGSFMARVGRSVPAGPGPMPPPAGTTSASAVPGPAQNGPVGVGPVPRGATGPTLRPGTERVFAGGGLLESTQPDGAVVAALQQDASSYSWVLATVGANNAAGYQLASGEPVLPIGGFNGSDPFPTLAQFQQYVADGRIHYFVRGIIGGTADGGSDVAAQITAWVRDTFEPTTIGGVPMYDLSQGG